MSKPNKKPMFQPPPAAASSSSSSSDVPAFFKGDHGPTYRASGGGGLDYHTAPSNMFGMGSSPNSANYAPAPLKFASKSASDPFHRPAQAYQGWGVEPVSQRESSKKLDMGLGELCIPRPQPIQLTLYTMNPTP